MPQVFNITKHSDKNVCYSKIIEKYINIRFRITHLRFLMRYQADEISEIPSKITKILFFQMQKSIQSIRLEFRRTSETQELHF